MNTAYWKRNDTSLLIPSNQGRSKNVPFVSSIYRDISQKEPSRMVISSTRLSKWILRTLTKVRMYNTDSFWSSSFETCNNEESKYRRARIPKKIWNNFSQDTKQLQGKWYRIKPAHRSLPKCWNKVSNLARHRDNHWWQKADTETLWTLCGMSSYQG